MIAEGMQFSKGAVARFYEFSCYSRGPWFRTLPIGVQRMPVYLRPHPNGIGLKELDRGL